MNVFLQIFKCNEVREGVGKASGKEYRMQDAECAILDQAGNVEEVGVLMFSKEQVENVKPGHYVGSFALRASKAKDGGRRIGAVLVGLKPVKLTDKGFVALPDQPKAA